MEDEKAKVLEKILKDKERGVRLIPVPGYGHKMQTIRSTSIDGNMVVRWDWDGKGYRKAAAL